MNTKTALSSLSVLIEAMAAEEELQKHLEAHPWMVVGVHSVDSNLVISKPPLGADHRPDFAFFWWHSGGSFLELLEIEAPSLEVFTGGDEFTSGFNHAVQQLADWEDWCRRHQDGIATLLEPLFDMGLITGLPSYRHVCTRLVAGRRASVQANARRRKRWEKRCEEVSGREIRTWDGFLEGFPEGYYANNSSWRYIACVRYREQGFERVEREPNPSMQPTGFADV